MSKFIIEINLDNSAFETMPHYEVARILNTVAKKIDQDDFEEDGRGFFLFDCNGNKVGHTKYEVG